jgi:sirohydrochlorin ferrochelatase
LPPLSVSAATVRTMTSTPNPNPVRWLLEVTAAAASAAPASFEQQRQLLRSVTQFDQPSRTWWAYIGTLDVRALRILERLFEAARRFGTEVRVRAIAAPDGWAGPSFSDASELADLVAAQADRIRPLGQLHLS